MLLQKPEVTVTGRGSRLTRESFETQKRVLGNLGEGVESQRMANNDGVRSVRPDDYIVALQNPQLRDRRPCQVHHLGVKHWAMLLYVVAHVKGLA
jgi:hypothetical protein